MISNIDNETKHLYETTSLSSLLRLKTKEKMKYNKGTNYI
uniref:Uncharacterized protein n=1 Tax=Anguilla anguilla TaxID=7936 RepID=A0A0E9RU23_ANGAN